MHMGRSIGSLSDPEEECVQDPKEGNHVKLHQEHSYHQDAPQVAKLWGRGGGDG